MQIRTQDTSPVDARRLEALAKRAEDAAQADVLMSSPAWEWYVGKVQNHIAQLERQVFDGLTRLEAREYDAVIGNRNGLQKALNFVLDAQREYERKHKEGNPT